MKKYKHKKTIISTLLYTIYLITIGWIILLIKLIQKSLTNKKNNEKNHLRKTYSSKSLLTDYEKYFYNIFKNNFSDIYLIIPQTNLATFIIKQKDFSKQYQNELYRNIDFGFFDKETLTPLLLIEINDNTHSTKDRIYRDKRVKEICTEAEINLITFYSSYENKPGYVINRIINELKNIKQ